MPPLSEIAHSLAQKLAPMHEWLHDGTPWHEPGSRLEATVVTALKEVERAALERAAHWHDEKCHRSRMRARDISGSTVGALMAQSRFEHDAQIHEQSASAIRALIDTPASEAPDKRDAEIKRLREVVRTLDEAMESFIQHARVDGMTSHDFKIIDQARDTARQTLDK